MSDDTDQTPLERAMELYFAALDAGSDPGALPDQHPELREFLLPMVRGEATGDEDGDADADAFTIGDYRVLRELGRGGMGIVYEVWQGSLDRRLAMKVISPGLVSDPSAVARFRREAAAAARLRHPGIVEVFQFGVADGQHFFVMERVDGAPLSACRDRFRTVPEVAALGEQVLAALQHAHEHGLVHRDIKPANILIRPDGRAVITDFGLASDEHLPTLTQAGAFLGTLDYASPEQVRGERVDARADVFAVGVVLYELLAGEHPFRAATHQATMQRLLAHDPPPLHEVDRRIARDAAAIVDAALHKDRSRRYASAAAMAADLQALRLCRTVSVRLPSLPERLVRWIRREPGRAAATVSVAFGALGLAAAAGFYVANRPVMEAGARAIDERARELSLGQAWLLYEDDPAATLQWLESQPGLGDDEEAVLLRASTLMRLQRHAEAEAALAAYDGDAARRMLAWMRSATGTSAGVDVANVHTAFVEGVIALDSAREANSEALYKAAMGHFHRAVLVAKKPRTTLLMLLLHCATNCRDIEMFQLAKTALAVHYPESMEKIAVLMLTAEIEPKATLPLLEARMRQEPGNPEWVYAMAVVHRELGDRIAAEAGFRRCVAMAPGHAQAWNNLGLLLRGAGKVGEAIAAYRQAVAARPTHARAWFNLGNALQGQQDLAGAEEAYRKAIQVRPRYSRPHHGLGVVMLARGRLEEAQAAFERSVALEPTAAVSHTNLGIVHARAGRLDEALRCAENARQLQPRDPRMLINLLQFARVLDRGDLTRPASVTLVEVAPNDARSWQERAYALLQHPDRDVPGARVAAARAIELAPDRAAAHLVAAVVAMTAADKEATRDHVAELDTCGDLLTKWEQDQLAAVRAWLATR